MRRRWSRDSAYRHERGLPLCAGDADRHLSPYGQHLRSRHLATDAEGRTVVDRPGVVLIDEIDVHLHPEWQRAIGVWLQEHFPRIQFIVTTHSPLVCPAANHGRIYHLPDRTADGEEEPFRLLLGGLRQGPRWQARSDSRVAGVRDAVYPITPCGARTRASCGARRKANGSGPCRTKSATNSSNSNCSRATRSDGSRATASADLAGDANATHAPRTNEGLHISDRCPKLVERVQQSSAAAPVLDALREMAGDPSGAFTAATRGGPRSSTSRRSPRNRPRPTHGRTSSLSAARATVRRG